MQKATKIAVFGAIGIFAVALVLIGAKTVSAQDPNEPPADSRITAFTVTPASTAAGATTNYTVSITLDTAIPVPSGQSGIPSFIRFNSQGGCPPDTNWQLCNPDLSNASISGVSVTIDPNQWDSGSLNFMYNNALSAGTMTFTITGVKNPTAGGGYYRGATAIMTPDVEPQPEQPWPEAESTPFLLGSIAVYGRILTPDGNAVEGVGVNLRSEDFSFNYGTGADQNGYFAIPATELNSGTYFLEVWVPGSVQGFISPDPIAVNYTGSAINKGTITLAQATKTIKGTVRYNTGAVVTVGEVWASKRGGGSWMNSNLEADGTYTLSVSGGEWEVGLNKGWNQETNQENSVDWTYQQPPTFASFANNNSTESKTINFEVTKTDAKIKGRVLKPDGTVLDGGWVEARAGEGPGAGSGVDPQTGRFEINVVAGTYTLNVWPNMDENNPDAGRLYLPEQKVTVAANQTADLGDIKMKQKNSKITGKVTLKDTNTGVADLRMSCWQINDMGWSQGTTGSDGTFSVWVNPGLWECDIDTWESTYIPVRADGPPRQYNVGENQTITGANYQVQQSDAAIQVKTVDVNGNAITNVWGWAFARKKEAGFGPGSEFGQGVDRGTATIRLLGGHTYIVGIHMPPDMGENALLLDKEVEVTVAVGQTKEVVLTLVAPDATITGFIQDQDGKLVKNTEAEVFANSEFEGGGGWMGTRLQPDGSFTIKVKGGKQYFLGFWFHNSPDFLNTHPEMAPFSVPKDGTVTKVLTAFRSNATIKATLLKPNGSKVDHGFVWCSNHIFLEDQLKGDFEGGKVIDTGNEAFGGVATIPIIEGKYECGAGQWGGTETYMPPKMQVVEIAKGATESITLQFRESDATLKATATRDDGGDIDFGWCWAWNPEGGFSGGDLFGGTANVPLTLGTWFVGCDTHTPDGFFRSGEQQVNITAKGDLAKSFVLSKSRFDIPEGITEKFDATSQKVITLPDGTTVNVPANALATEGQVTLTAQPDINLFFTEDTKPLNFAWDFSALDSNNQLIEEFNSNVNICISYNQDYIDEEGIDESDIVAKFYNSTSGQWQLPPGVTQDTENDTVCFSVDHFTEFALATGEAGSNSISRSARLGATGPYNIVATPMTEGGPQVGVFTKDGQMIATWFAYSSDLRMGLTTHVADLDGNGEVEVITIPGEGFDAQLRIFDKNGNILTQFMAYDAGFRKGVNVTAFDLDGDGVREIITAPAKEAAADLKVFSKDGVLLTRFNAYGTGYTLGAGVKAADLDGDGNGEIVTYPLSGSGQVRIFDKDGNALTQFNTYGDGYNKGIHLTLSDMDGDGTVEVITSPRDSVAHVKVFTKDGGLLAQFIGYASTFTGGARTFVGDVDGDGAKEIVVLPDTNGSAQARVFNKDGNLLSQFFAYPQTTRGSFSAVVGDLDGDGAAEISFGPEKGLGPQVRVFDKDGNILSQFFTLHTGYRGGINVSLINQ